MGNVKNGKFVYKNKDSMKKMHEFYDKTLASLDVLYSEDSKHLPSDETMIDVCKRTKEFFKNS